MFGKKDPIYVQVKNIGINPDVAETIYNVVSVDSQSSGYIFLDLKETGANTEIFRNSIAERGELLYLSTEDSDDFPEPTSQDTIRVIDEEILKFWLRIPPPIGSPYKRSEDVMVDRAEIGTEWQKYYDFEGYCECNPRLWNISTDHLGKQLHDNIGGEPNLVWYKNFDLSNFDSQPSHWKPPLDTLYADAVDMASWGGHNNYGFTWRYWHFFIEDSACIGFERSETNLGDQDADWLIFDTCNSLYGSVQDLKDDLLTSDRCAHMFLGFVSGSYHNYTDCGEYFAKRLKEVGIKEAWFNYCQYKQPPNTKVRVFGAVDCMDDSVAGPGPVDISRDPTKDSAWDLDDYPPPP